MADGVADIDLFSWWLLDFFSSGNTNRIPNPYWCDHVMSRSTVMSRSYWKLHSQHLNLDLAIFLSCMCNCKQFFQVSHSFHYNTIHLMQTEAVLHVNCLLNCSWSHTNSVSLFLGVMHYLNYVGSLKETKYCVLAEIFKVFSVNEKWNGYFGFLIFEENVSANWKCKVSGVAELIQWFPAARRKRFTSLFLAFL